MNQDGYFFEEILESCIKLRDWNRNVQPNKEMEEYYQEWVDQLENKKITCPKLCNWLEIQSYSKRSKDKGFEVYIKRLIKGKA